MKYKQIKITFDYAKPNRFYRTLLVKENINLVDLGCAIVSAFNGTFEHYFLFSKDKLTYNPKIYLEDSIFETELLMNDYNLVELGDKFKFTYDTGEGYDFTCEVKDTDMTYNEDENDDVILIAGAGQGIWEDNIHSLCAYLDGKLDPNASEADDEYSLPWNFENEKFSDFDNFDLEEEKESFEALYLYDREAYIEREELYNNSDDTDDELLDDDDFDNFDLEQDEEEDYNLDKTLAGLYHMTMLMAEQLVKMEPHKTVYEKLLETKTETEAKEAIAKELIFLYVKSASEGREFSPFELDDAINNLQ